MKPPHPSALHGAPALHPRPMERLAPTPHIQAGRVMVYVPRQVPVLTVYADGFVQPNAEAAALFMQGGHNGLCFQPPPPPRRGCHPKPWGVTQGTCHRLLHHPTKPGQMRLSAAGHAPPPGRYVLTPVAGAAHRYTLLPV